MVPPRRAFDTISWIVRELEQRLEIPVKIGTGCTEPGALGCFLTKQPLGSHRSPDHVPAPPWLWITADSSSFHFGFLLDHPEEIVGIEADANGPDDVAWVCDVAYAWLEGRLTDEELIEVAYPTR